MKIKTILVLLLTVILLNFDVSYAKINIHYRTYEIFQVTENSITMRGKDGKEHILHWEPKGLKVGDRVRYDRKRHKLKRKPLPPATN